MEINKRVLLREKCLPKSTELIGVQRPLIILCIALTKTSISRWSLLAYAVGTRGHKN